MKMKFKAAAVATVALAGLVGAGMTVSAQAETLKKHRVLTVKKHHVAPVVAAAPAPAPGPGTIVTAPLNAASTVVGLPFQALGAVFPVGGPRSGGVTAVRYVNAGPEEAKIDEGFATPVPVDKSGPIFVVQNGDPTISPLVFIGAPIAAAGTIAQTPFRILAVPFGG